MEYLEEKVEMHDTLNPNIWTNDNHLRPEVKNKLEEIVNEFLIELEENEIPIHILDVHLVGSNASYNYTDKSDLDVHIIANLEDVTCDPYVLNLLYGYFKSYFNDKYDISIHGVDVELYIEDVNTSSISNGIYSLFDDEWVKFPEKTEVPDVDISKDIIPYKNMYDSAMNSKDGMEAIMLVNDLYLLRRNSLSTDGEYGIGNLIFKEFRNNGWLDKLKDLSNEYKSETLTLEQLNESLNDFMSMEHLMSEAKERGVRPKDLFDKYDYLVDAKKFFNYMVRDTEPSYQTGPKTRILNNRPYNEFYKTLLGYLDSLGTNKPYSKIEPALVKELPNGSLQPLDGRHRSQFCMILGIPLPVRVQQQGANKDYESLEDSLNKVSSNGMKSNKLASTIKSRPLQPKVINEIMNNGSVGNDVDNSQLISLVEKEFGVSSFPVRGPTFLMPDGKFLTIADTFERRNSFEDFPCHAEVQHFLKSHNLTDASGDYIDGSPVLSELGAIRINDIEEENNYIELSPRRPTPSQLESLLRHLDSNSARYRTVVVTDPGMNNIVTYDYGATITDDIVKNIKRYYASNILYEDYLDDENKFWNYNTRQIDGDNIFDPYVGESSYARDMIKLAESRKVDKEGHYAGYVEMSPREYFDACAKGFGIPAKDQINTVSNDKGVIQTLNTILDKYKVRFPVAYLDYSFNNFSQEGRHRMYVAGERVGWDKKFPVLVIHTTEEGNKAKHEERITRYIIKALNKTEKYTYSNFDEIKEQFIYDIEDWISNPKVEFKETADTYIFIVNGVEYEEEKDSFNFYNEEDETNINDMDVEDFLDLDDLSDDDIFNM